MGFEVAKALGCDLDVLVVRKVGFPGQPELAMGAVAEGGVVIENPDVASLLRGDPGVFERGVELARTELEAKVRSLRGDTTAQPIEGRTVVIVDDGLATGSTALAAVEAARRRGAMEVWLAVPVAPREAVSTVKAAVDQLVVLHQPRFFMAVGAWYEDFTQTSDAEVRDLLRRAAEKG